MTGLLLIVLMQMAWSFGLPQDRQSGGGSFAYSDSTGQKYSGTYQTQDGKVIETNGNLPTHFKDTAFPGYGYGYGYGDYDYGFPEDNYYYPTNDFSHLENYLQEFPHPFHHGYGFGGHRKGFGAYHPFPTFTPPQMHPFRNSAYAGAAIGPGYRHQIAAVHPENMGYPNINVAHFADSVAPSGGNHFSVSSRSFSSSSNINGKEQNHRGAETVVDDNGKVTKYAVKK